MKAPEYTDAVTLFNDLTQRYTAEEIANMASFACTPLPRPVETSEVFAGIVLHDLRCLALGEQLDKEEALSLEWKEAYQRVYVCFMEGDLDTVILRESDQTFTEQCRRLCAYRIKYWDTLG